MDETDDAALGELMTGFARSVLAREAQERDRSVDTAGLKIFKMVRSDVDDDGEDETCFAAGVAQWFSQGMCGLIDPSQGGPQLVELVPYQEGFRDVVVADIDNDGRPEIMTWGQVGSGANLNLAILRYDGAAVTSLFPDGPFHQGLLETKDLDLDGVDELVIWEGRWEKGAHWEPNPFTIHVYHASPGGYQLVSSLRMNTAYYPSSIVSRTIGLFGMPTSIEHRYTSVTERRDQFESLLAAGQVTDEYAAELGGQQALLRDEGFLEESLSISDIAMAANNLLPPTPAGQQRALLLWRDRARTATLLGDYPAAVQGYARAVGGADEEALQELPAYFQAGLHRELAMAEAFLGDYEKALSAYDTAFALLDRLDMADADNRGELSRLHSNAGLVRSWIGDERPAIEHFHKAINETGIANVHRLAGRIEEAVTWYEAALRSLSAVSDRDRESDANLELGLALIETGQSMPGLTRIFKALLLTSVGNIRQQDWKHYLYLGTAYRALHQLDHAEKAFRKAESSTRRWVTSEIRWQALYGLGLVLQDLGRPDEATATLEQAVAAVEQFRRQYLPEALKISMLASKSNPYDALVGLLTLPAENEPGTRAATAFGYVEQAKSRVFLERLAISPIRWPESAPAELAAEETQLIDELRVLILRESASREPGSSPEHLDRVEERLNGVWARIEASGREGAEYVSLRRGLPLPYSSVRELLNDKSRRPSAGQPTSSSESSEVR
jgi:tetratricopeptide (TPR) repeat protein